MNGSPPIYGSRPHKLDRCGLTWRQCRSGPVSLPTLLRTRPSRTKTLVEVFAWSEGGGKGGLVFLAQCGSKKFSATYFATD
jgi:hypothetical protein